MTTMKEETMPANPTLRRTAFATALLALAAGASAQQSKWPDITWLFTSFHGKGDGLHLSASADGKAWRDLGKVFLKPSAGSGLMRDPHILRGPDGVFRMVWTTGWKDKGIGYAASTDLVNWSAQRYLPIFEKTAGATDAWAPETFYDDAGQQYVITVSSDIAGRFPETKSDERMNHRTYYVTTKDFVTFSEPKLFLDPGFDHIDTTVVRDGGREGERYIAVFKEGDRQKAGKWGAVRWAVADSALGPYRVMPEPIVSGLRAEGPTLYTQDGKTTLLVDFYADKRYGAFETTDWKQWTDVSAQVAVANGQRHGTVLAVPAWLAKDLAAAEHATAPAAQAVEPKAAAPAILEGFTADPSIRLFGDTYYIYPTSDKPNWQTTDFSVWSSKNLVDWKKERMILDVANDVKWANVEAWAPDVIERNGTYYMYFCAQGNIGVATAKSPTGRFVDALGKPLIAKGTGVQSNTIDPYPFIDDDGQAYLYYGNGKYYFMWSIDDARSPNYRVGWGVADSPLGPVRSPDRDFIVLQRNGPAVATAHHSVVNVPGTDRWYAAYHRHALPQGNGYQRQTVLARMEFNADGSIRPMDPMTVPFRPGDAGEPVRNGQPVAPAAASR
jgi:hypothetical protein